VALCEKVAGFQAATVWQVEHTVEMPAWLTAGASAAWQAAQVAGVP
jgi:hypothetical protein